jgi:hypothetical protein
MRLTGYFLLHHVFLPQGRTLPAARLRLAERMRGSGAAADTMPDPLFWEGPKGHAWNL